jgi:aldose 1-epimerase
MSELITIKNSHLEVKISPEIGASIYSMRYLKGDKWIDIMRPTPQEALQKGDVGQFASFNLFPYSNRLKDAVLNFRGKEYQLEVNFPDGTAIHGEAWTRPWKVLETREERVSFMFNSTDFEDISWPFPFRVLLEYEIKGNRLFVSMMLENIGDEVMPGGMGIHPYFMRNLTTHQEKVYLEMPVKGIYPGETQIPTGHWIDISDKYDFTVEKELKTDFLDNCFRVDEGPITLKWPESGVKLTIGRDSIFGHVVIYCPEKEKEFFALEPVTNCNNGFNMAEGGIGDTGTLLIEPGQAVKGEVVLLVQNLND